MQYQEEITSAPSNGRLILSPLDWSVTFVRLVQIRLASDGIQNLKRVTPILMALGVADYSVCELTFVNCDETHLIHSSMTFTMLVEWPTEGKKSGKAAGRN